MWPPIGCTSEPVPDDPPHLLKCAADRISSIDGPGRNDHLTATFCGGAGGGVELVDPLTNGCG